MIGLIYDFTLAAVLALASVLSVFSFTAGKNIPNSVCGLTVLLVSALVLFLRLKTRGRMILAGILAAVASGMALTMDAEQIAVVLSKNGWVLWVLPVCAGSVLLEWLTKGHRALRVLPCAALTGTLAYSLFQAVPLVRTAVLMSLLYLVLSVTELIQSGWKKEGAVKPEEHLVFILPFILVLFAGLAVIKTPAEPFDWKLVKDLARNARSTYERFIQSFDRQDGWLEGEGQVGFSEEGGFFGNLHASDYEVLEVRSNTALGARVYLGGRSFDTFDGRQWTKQDESDENERMYDLIETTYAVASHDAKHVPDYMRSSSLEIRLKGIRTDHVFAPSKTIPSLRDRSTKQTGGDLLFPNRRVRQYTIDYYRLNRAYEGFDELLNSSEAFLDLDEETMITVSNTLQHQDLSGFTEEGLLEYRRRIHEVYAQKPVLSERMQERLEQQLQGEETVYGKLLKLSEMFADMIYTTKPGELPETVQTPADFLDDLVFERQEGYCTHFATAFVLLARAEGIPARYVQGYCITTASKGVTNVFSDTAHAWAEAYMDGIGWVEFDPTPGYAVRSGWKVRRTEEEEGNGRNVTIAVEEEEEEEEETSGTSSHPNVQMEKQRRSLSAVSVSMILAGLFLILYLPLDFSVRRYRYKRKSRREKVRYLFQRILRILRRMGLKIRNGETLSEFAERAKRTVPQMNPEFISVYEEVIYGEREVSEEDVKLFEEETAALRRLWLNRLGEKLFHRHRKISGPMDGHAKEE